MRGITFDSWDFFSGMPEENLFEDTALQVDYEVFNHPHFKQKLKKLHFASLTVRNPVNARLNRLILESPFKLQADYLESMAKQIRSCRIAGVNKIMLDFDLAGTLGNDLLYSNLLKLLGAVKGIAFDNQIDTELLFRLPFPSMENFILLAANFRRTTLLGMNFAVDMHIHEAGFDREQLPGLLLPLEFDIGSINFLYDAALGNKVNTQTLKFITDHLEKKGINCDYFLCPSGNINFQSAAPELIKWLNIQ